MSVVPAADPTSITYSNGKLGYVIVVPPLLRSQDDVAAGDGKRFATEDGEVTLTVLGTKAPSPNLDELYAGASKSSAQRDVTYKARQADWFVVSGFEGERVFYSKVVVQPDRWARFDLSYSKARKAAVDPLIGGLAKSFHFATRCLSNESPLEGTLGLVSWEHPNPDIGMLSAYVLTLASPICLMVEGSPVSASRVHVLADDKSLVGLDGKHIKVKGEYMLPVTIYHRGDVVMTNPKLITK
jgi:hypothetical protein